MDLTRSVASTLDVHRIFRAITTQVRQILTYDGLLILLPQNIPDAQHGIDNGGDGLMVAFCSPPRLEIGSTWLMTDFSFGALLMADQPSVIDDFTFTAIEVQLEGDRALMGVDGRAALIVPIEVAPHSRVLGALVLVSQTPHLYDVGNALLAAPLTNMLALSLEHQRLSQEAKALAIVEERDRLALEIHDTLAQLLNNIIINLTTLRTYAAIHTPTEVAILAESESLARGALEQTRQSILNRHPAPLHNRSLQDALVSELEGLARRSGLMTKLHVTGTERELEPDVADALFRVSQEALQNVYKHADALNVTLALEFGVLDLTITVDDDGMGFVPDTARLTSGGGFGLPSMAARVQNLHGDLRVTSRPGQGTSIHASLPYTRSDSGISATARQGVKYPLAVRPIRVLIVDDHPMVRQGIRRILERLLDFQIIGEAEDGLSAIVQTGHLHPDVVLLDLKLPNMSGIEVLPELKAAYPAVEVVILSVLAQDEEVFAGLKAGARGYLLKDAEPETIVAAIRAASKGQSLLPPTMTTRVVERFTELAQREPDPDALTERELEVLECLAQGLTHKEIAGQLSITPKTVQYHISLIMRKLHVSSSGAAIAEGVRRKLVT
ncbi:MAG TPA: hybrid sensor histidine kinase/response regulator transcription factor [Chloroflexia bacterium]|nr:hybrid sensor histidine kinase/response regulator transcription factor [Chloroflexia bacterium]